MIFTFYIVFNDLFLSWFSTRDSDNRKYFRGRKLYACIITRKFKGLDSREITSLPEIKNVMRTWRVISIIAENKPPDRMLITRFICIQWKFSTPDQQIPIKKRAFSTITSPECEDTLWEVAFSV